MASANMIETILARFLVDPGFLEKVRTAPLTALEEYKLDPDVRAQVLAADFDQIRRFSGFISKVQHNHLWGPFPATRLLLVFYGIELAVFTEYRKIQLSPEVMKEERDRRIQRFLDFLANYIREKKFPGLFDVLTHERLVWEVRNTACDDASGSKVEFDLSRLGWRGFLQLAVRRDKTLKLASYSCDPAELAKCVSEGRFNGKLPRRRSRIAAYLKDRATGELRTLELDAVSALVLSQVETGRNVKAVVDAARSSGLREMPPAAFREFFEAAYTAGLIHLDVPEN